MPRLGPLESDFTAPPGIEIHDCGKAFAAWQWYNYCESRVPPGKQRLRINLDETAVCLYQGGRKGNVFISRALERIQQGSLGTRRTFLTHVALICDDPDVQPLLPQFILVNQRTLPDDAELAAIQAACPPNVIVLREKSAWVTNVVFMRMMRRLRVALAPVLRDRQPILIMDTASPHIAREVLWLCGGLGFWVVIAPAKLTWLLQPLDTDGFAQYKDRLQDAFQEAQMRAAGGAVGVRELIAAICTAVRYVLQGRLWASAFDRDGFGDAQGSLGARVVANLQIEEPLAISTDRPTHAQVKACFPSNRLVYPSSVWRAFDAPPAVVVAHRLPWVRRG